MISYFFINRLFKEEDNIKLGFFKPFIGNVKELSEDKISNTKAREITTFLAAAKDADPDNEHYKETDYYRENDRSSREAKSICFCC